MIDSATVSGEGGGGELRVGKIGSYDDVVVGRRVSLFGREFKAKTKTERPVHV